MSDDQMRKPESNVEFAAQRIAHAIHFSLESKYDDFNISDAIMSVAVALGRIATVMEDEQQKTDKD